MTEIRANEREFSSQVISWLNSILEKGGYPFERATGESSVATDKSTLFPDVQLWINRESGQGFCGWELKTPDTAVDDQELINNAVEKAKRIKARYFVTWNMRDAILWQIVPDKSEPQRLKIYPSLSIKSVEDFKIPPKRIALEERTREILNDLSQLYNEGHITFIGTDDWFFIDRLTKTTQKIQPFFKERLFDMVASDAQFSSDLREWAAKQGVIIADQEEFLSAISSQIVYQLLGRLLFFEVLRRFRPELKMIHLANLSEAEANKELKAKFAEIRAIDYQAIFEEDLPDRIPISAKALPILRELIVEFDRRDFANLPQEVLGSVFENLIPAGERHRLGQYFTREDLVDFITAFCVRTKDAQVLDPTCGTGTFLIRAYNRLKWNFAVRDHQTLLSQIWGIDLAPFPAELATLNLYRQDISNIGNFPRILKKDFFTAKRDQKYEFPPNKLFDNDPLRKIKVPFPLFDAIIGNPPYIRQGEIDKVSKNYSESVIKPAIALDKMSLAPNSSKIGEQMDSIEISGQADIYASMFVHAAALLKEGGRLGFVTSNSWLGADYGKELQEFFLRNFKIIAIVESRVEPWFETAQVNTVFTILERCKDKGERENHLIKFVNIKKKLREFIPWDMQTEAVKRWQGINTLVSKIESAGREFIKIAKNGSVTIEPSKLINDFEDENFRIRVIRQGVLKDEITAQFGGSHWGRFLRAPSVYFELRELLKDKLVSLSDKNIAEPMYGLKPGVTEFFVVTPERVKEFGIEKEFLVPFLTSFRDIEKPIFEPKDIKERLFVCSLSKNELRRLGKKGALKYIEWGETQRTTGRGAVGKAGILWSKVPSVKNRELWYDIGEREPGDIIINQFVGERIFFPLNINKVFVSNTFFEVNFTDTKLRDLWAALTNSTLVYLFAEIAGRTEAGGGVLRLYGPEIKSLLLPDAREISKVYQKQILVAFSSILKRSIKNISDEVKQKDRREFDTIVLEALGLKPATYLDAIYKGLADLVETRIKLGKMQSVAKREKPKRDIPKVKEEVVREVLPDGLKPFPESFLPSGLAMREVAIPPGRLQLGEHFLGTQEVINESGGKYKAASIEEAEFIMFAQKPRSHIIRIPKEQKEIHNAVVKYKKYLKEIRERLMRAFVIRTGDENTSERLTAEVMEEIGVLF
ncbi:MAG: N-6 DNA methylase [Candidatus Azambacteria bacterium]|nr:N-6 DNA methylase [Candidatus Azambacteria bacterium]